MATKTARKSGPAFRAALAQVQPALAAWRQRRKHREPIPQTLWSAMVRLAREYGLSPVAQALRVNYTALKGHLVAAGGAPPASAARLVSGAFLEVPVSGWPAAAQWVIELEDGCGAKLTLRLPPGDSATALTLVQGLWAQRA